MVARDGIEPPTPAFSGPRSTTELSGPSANTLIAISCPQSGWPGRVVSPSNNALQQPCQYINCCGLRPNLPGPEPTRNRKPQAALGFVPRPPSRLPYTERQSCEPLVDCS